MPFKSLLKGLNNQLRINLDAERAVAVFDEWAASLGMALAAKDVFEGAKDILGIAVAKPLPKRG